MNAIDDTPAEAARTAALATWINQLIMPLVNRTEHFIPT
jgi:hypothetical protein